MSLPFQDLSRALCVAMAAQGVFVSAGAAGAVGAVGAHAVGPSDCLARDADSTCATAVAGAPAPPVVPIIPRIIYNDAIGGVPSSGYAYWGFDFASNLAGVASPFPADMFVNRSPYPVTITLSFTIPTYRGCGSDCLPGVQFEVDTSWINVRPPLVITGNTASASYQVRPGQGYGWVIGLWQSSNPRLTVSVPHGSLVSLQDIGLPHDISIAQPIDAVTGMCDCWDGSTAACSLGSRFSNGLMGPWYRSNEFYVRGGAFNDCPIQR